MTPSPSKETGSSLSSLSTIGTHCSLSTCRNLDFLPIKCQSCSLTFCSTHASPPSSHDCKNKRMDTDDVKDGRKFEDKFEDLLPDRDRVGFDRKGLEKVKEEKKLKAQQLLKKNFGPISIASEKASGTGGLSSIATKKPVSPMIKLMQLKQRAEPLTAASKTVKMQDRCYLTTYYKDLHALSEAVKMKEVYFDRSASVGKLIDLLASTFGVMNENNRTTEDTRRLSLVKGSPESEATEALHTSDTIVRAVENGGEVMLVRGSLSKN